MLEQCRERLEPAGGRTDTTIGNDPASRAPSRVSVSLRVVTGRAARRPARVLFIRLSVAHLNVGSAAYDGRQSDDEYKLASHDDGGVYAKAAGRSRNHSEQATTTLRFPPGAAIRLGLARCAPETTTMVRAILASV